MERLTLNKMQRLAGHRRALQDVQPRLVLPGGFVPQQPERDEAEPGRRARSRHHDPVSFLLPPASHALQPRFSAPLSNIFAQVHGARAALLEGVRTSFPRLDLTST